jgi:hypothetical protein
LPGLASSGFFSTWGRIYTDAGYHPEFSTIESDHPDDVLRALLIGQMLLRQAAVEADIELYTVNVDYCGATWGRHYNHACTTPKQIMYDQLIPLLASQVCFGCGGILPQHPGIVFTLSPRCSAYIVRSIGPSSTGDRGLCHMRDEPLARKYWRAHLSSGESLRTHWSTWLRLASTALVIDAVEAGMRPGDRVRLSQPVSAMHAFCTDPTCKAVAQTSRGEQVTMLDVQRAYLTAVQQRLDDPAMPVWAPLACQRWARTLDLLQSDPAEVTCIDWCIKFKLFRDWARAQHRIEWAELAEMNRQPLWPGLRARDFRRLRGLRDELIEIDIRFGGLNPEGIFDRLDHAGTFDHRIPGVSDSVETDSLPTRGRAAVRAREIAHLAGRRGARCEWDRLLDGAGNVLRLDDPDCQAGEWQRYECPAPPVRF